MKLTREFHPADALAGLSLAGLLLPEAVAYSGLANLPPQAGVIGMFAGLVCYALVGTSRYAIVTATSSSAAVFAAATLALGANATTGAPRSLRSWCAQRELPFSWPASQNSGRCRT